ncbi:MAG: isoleucyl-tRNA synthetase, nonfunctional [Candidatus Woesebacteria bacterium GW2011_GWA1_39_12]|uniref:Isoleucyl-tRNA synthetase, nonfunctional n=2 Tax=Candidatus Woeseibacteriota TaxID=1752722 RepID=A0A0G0LYZ4_9BACT|nr:MAG: isoleucyl-tRNA synthetase, nonfunctional [Candidatus Woesebacteria bacterium GW2011_GWA1_39_12]
MYVRQNPSENLLFGYHVADETRRRFHLKLWNVYNFFVTYANLDGWSPMAGNKEPGGTPLDDWILSRLSETIKDVTYFLEKYDAYLASGSLEGFLDDLSLWYIRRSRDRVGPAGESAKDKDNFYKTCHTSLVGLSLLLAPFTPFISEVIYRNLTKGDSLHLGSWPSAGKIDEKLIKQMSNLRLVVEKVHAIRKDKGIPVRQPLARLETEAPFEVPNELKSYLTDEVNVKSWILRKGKTLENSLDTKITQELEEEAKTRELIRSIQEERRKMGMSLSEKVDVSNTWLPSALGLVQRLKSKALIDKLSKGDFKVEKV